MPRGGARPNTGGARPGAGRPPKKTEAELLEDLKQMKKQIAIAERKQRASERKMQASVKPIQAEVIEDSKTVPTTTMDRPLSSDERQALLEERRKALAEIFPSGPEDPLEFLQSVQQNVLLNADLRIKAAMKLADFKHVKPGEKGKKEQDLDDAENVGKTSRFGVSAPPKLISSR